MELNSLSEVPQKDTQQDRVSINSLELINDKTLDEIEDDIEPDVKQYIEACQRGDLALVTELLESTSVSVKSLDQDGVSGLHWAAINNRLSVVKYLVKEGSEVDLKGGQLEATLLHWACRYGLVYIADYLIREAGADPTICDNQGFNCLHLAVHSSNIMCVIYILYFTEIPIDSLDPSQRTSLHWALYQGDSLTVDVLLKNGANYQARDMTQFTPLHWSLIRGTHKVIKSLVECGGDVHDTNNDGKDCFLIAKDMNCSGVLKTVLKECGMDNKGVKKVPIMPAKLAKIVTFLQPYLLLFLTFQILELSEGNIVPRLIFVLLIFLANHYLLMRHILPCYINSHNPLIKTPYMAGIFSGTTFWILICWIMKILPETFSHHWFVNFIFAISAALVIFSFQKSMFINPGFIPTPAKKETIQATITELLELRQFDSKRFCIHTFIRKPLRSKFSSFAKANVARFDHYCPWVFNDIGVRNHKLFVTFILSLEIAIISYIYLAIKYFNTLDHSDDCSVLSQSLCNGYDEESFVFNLTIWAMFQLVWLSFLICVQLFQICKGMTSYEAANVHKEGIDPNGNVTNPFYSSVPPEDADNETTNSINGGSSLALGEGSGRKVGAISNFISKSSWAKLVGLDLFLLTAQDAVRMNRHLTSTDFGVKQNWLDFWFLVNGGETYTMKTLLRLPIQGELNLNGKLVDYYKLWELPSKDASSIV